MDYIVKSTTPTITLKVTEPIPEGSVSTITVSQGISAFNPEPFIDYEDNSVSFVIPSSYTSAMVSGSPVRIQQTLLLPNGVIETFPFHDVMVRDILYVEPNEPYEMTTENYQKDTEDTVVDDTKTYFEYVYVIFDNIGELSPNGMGLYEKVLEEYVPTSDLTPVGDKVYYMKQLSTIEPVGVENPSALGWLEIVDPSEVDNDEVQTLGLDNDVSQYISVVPVGDENPLELGWLIVNDLGYFEETLDDHVVSGTQYYKTETQTYMDNADAFYKEFNEETFSALNGLVYIDDAKMIPATVKEGDNPSENKWYEMSGSEFVKSNDTSIVSGKVYYVDVLEDYDPETMEEWDLDSDEVGGLIPDDEYDVDGDEDDEEYEIDPDEEEQIDPGD